MLPFLHLPMHAKGIGYTSHSVKPGQRVGSLHLQRTPEEVEDVPFLFDHVVVDLGYHQNAATAPPAGYLLVRRPRGRRTNA